MEILKSCIKGFIIGFVSVMSIVGILATWVARKIDGDKKALKMWEKICKRISN